MTLATRLSAFFLAALAVVLLGFSLALYILAEGYLYRQLDGQLAAALEMLVAAVDVEADGLKWHPAEDRPVTLGADAGPENIRFVVVDDRGRTVAHSANYVAADFPSQWRPTAWPARLSEAAFGASGHWRLAARRFAAAQPDQHDANDDHNANDEAATLDLIAGISSSSVAASVRELGLALLMLSTTFWVACAVVGRWLCHRALSPLTRMATAARQMTATDLSRQLPSPQTGDELEGSAQRSTICSAGCRKQSSGSSVLPATPRTSCALRWPACSVRSRWLAVVSVRRPTTPRCSTRSINRRFACGRSSSRCCFWPAAIRTGCPWSARRPNSTAGWRPSWPAGATRRVAPT